MKRFDDRIESIEKRIPEKHDELEEIRRQLEEEYPDDEILIESQGGIISYVQLPRQLSPEEWAEKIKINQEAENDG